MVAVILGRLIPPHKGHDYLIARALAECTEVYLLLCTLRSDVIPGTLRASWLQTMYRKEIDRGQFHLIVIDEENEAASRHAPEAPSLWAASVRKYVPVPIDRVYSSEQYGSQFAAHLGASCVSVDPTRNEVPINASRIREDPLAAWKFIPPIVRPYFAARGWTHIAEKDRPRYLIIVVVPDPSLALALAKACSSHYAKKLTPSSLKKGRIFLFCTDRSDQSLHRSFIDEDNILVLPHAASSTLQSALEYLSALTGKPLGTEIT